MRDLVVVSLEAWDQVWRRNQHLVSGLLEIDPQLRILFVEPATDPVHALRRGVRPRRGTGLRAVKPDRHRSWRGQLWAFQPTKWLPRRLDGRADAKLARAVVRAASRLGMAEPLLWVNDPFGAEVLRRTRWTALYDITDDWLLADRLPQEVARVVEQESFLMQACREVVVCSSQLQRDKGTWRPVHLVPNAVDVRAYRQVRARPVDLPKGPVAMYVGTLHRDRLDVDLCERIAHRISGTGTLVFVGPVALDGSDRRRLEEAGAILLGARPSEDVPAYLQNAAVLTVPHVLTPFTESLDPIKAYEYQAAGRPVVSTSVPGFRDAVTGAVRIADAGKFPDAVKQLIQENPASNLSPEVPDWSERVRDFLAILHQAWAP